MKACIENIKKEFTPFKLIIEVEDINDLKELWCRFNTSNENIKKYNSEYKESKYDSKNDISIFDILDNRLN